MIQRYTFLQHPFHVVLSNSRQLVSGLDKCIAVFYDDTKKETTALSFDGDITTLAINDPEFIADLRITKKKANWVKPEQVPFETKTNQEEQLSFIDEEKSSVLELRFANSADGKFDVIYFYFKNNIANFKLSSANEAMAITVKEVIQNLLYNQVSLLLTTHQNNKTVHQKIAKTINLNPLQAKITDLEADNFKLVKDAYTYLLNQLTVGETTEFVLSTSAVNKLKQLNYSLPQVSEVLKTSLEVLINKYLLDDLYEIADYDIVLPEINPLKKTINQQNLEKTILFLDRYEQAAKLLLVKSEKITGANIGNACEPPISAAAISDILKKHNKKITFLLNQYPEKWKVIRNNFKPIINILKSSGSIYTSKVGA